MTLAQNEIANKLSTTARTAEREVANSKEINEKKQAFPEELDLMVFTINYSSSSPSESTQNAIILPLTL